MAPHIGMNFVCTLYLTFQLFRYISLRNQIIIDVFTFWCFFQKKKKGVNVSYHIVNHCEIIGLFIMFGYEIDTRIATSFVIKNQSRKSLAPCKKSMFCTAQKIFILKNSTLKKYFK